LFDLFWWVISKYLIFIICINRELVIKIVRWHMCSSQISSYILGRDRGSIISEKRLARYIYNKKIEIMHSKLSSVFLCRIEFDYIYYIIKCIILPAHAEIDHLPWTYPNQRWYHPNKEPTCLTLAITWPCLFKLGYLLAQFWPFYYDSLHLKFPMVFEFINNCINVYYDFWIYFL
jgi:hypothetical protein